MSEQELLSLPVDVALKHKEDEFKNEVYLQRSKKGREDLREYDRENRTGEYGPNAKTFFKSTRPPTKAEEDKMVEYYKQTADSNHTPDDIIRKKLAPSWQPN